MKVKKDLVVDQVVLITEKVLRSGLSRILLYYSNHNHESPSRYTSLQWISKVLKREISVKHSVRLLTFSLDGQKRNCGMDIRSGLSKEIPL